MKRTLTSKERLLQTINHSEPDHVPLCLKWWGRPYPARRDEGWEDQFERVRRTLRLGLDDTVGFNVPRPLNPNVRVRTWKETQPGETYPLLFKEYETPEGTLSQVVRQTGDWPFGDDIPLFTDYVVPRARSKKYLIEDLEDLKALPCLFRRPTEAELEAFYTEAEHVKGFAAAHGVLVECGMSSEGGVESGVLLGDALPWLCGVENTIKAFAKNPQFLHRLLDIILEWDLSYVQFLLKTGCVDLIVHRGWYENAHFWPPRMYQTFLAPRLKKLVERVHQGSTKFCYIMSMGIMPLLKTLKDLDIDVLYGVDPVQGGADLAQIKMEVGDQVCLWGVVNSAVTLGYGTGKQVVKAVTAAVSTLAPGGGFILAAIDQLFEDTPWTNIAAMIETWRRVGMYTLRPD